MDGFKICGCALLALCVSALLKSYKSNMAPVVGTGAVCLLLAAAVRTLVPCAEYVRTVLSQANLSDVGGVVLCCTVTMLVGSFTEQICKSFGENALAEAAVFGAKACCVALALPLFRKVFDETLRLVS